MKLEKTFIEGLYVLIPQAFGDNRGWFFESYSAKSSHELGIDTVFVQDNHSYSSQKDIIRGLHCQVNPDAQTKLIRCTKGTIIDYVVDLRQSSPTYKKWFSIELSAENKKQLYIPKGFLHGFKTITDDVEVQYKVDEYYSPKADRSIRFDDPDLGVDWGLENPVLSDKDRNAPLLKDSDVIFK